MKFLKGDSIVFIMMILSSSFLVLFTALFSSVEQNVQYSFTVIIECSQLIKQHTLVYIPILVNLWREGGWGGGGGGGRREGQVRILARICHGD